MDRKRINEGYEKKGGINIKPQSPRPAPPKPQTNTNSGNNNNNNRTNN